MIKDLFTFRFHKQLGSFCTSALHLRAHPPRCLIPFTEVIFMQELDPDALKKLYATSGKNNFILFSIKVNLGNV